MKTKTGKKSHLKPVHNPPPSTDGDMTEADRKKAQSERQRRAALRSSVIQELRQQYSDAPEEIRERRDFQSDRDSREDLHRCVCVCVRTLTLKWVRSRRRKRRSCVTRAGGLMRVTS